MDPRLECAIADTGWMLSARRLWEYDTLGQSHDLRLHTVTSTTQLIDLIDGTSGRNRLTGFSLHRLEAGDAPDGFDISSLQPGEFRTLRALVQRMFARLSIAEVRRSGVDVFADQAHTGPFGLRGLYSRVQQRLSQTKATLPPAQWLATINNYTRSGVPEEEIRFSGVREFLARCAPGSRVSGIQLANACVFEPVRLSALRFNTRAQRPLRLSPAPEREFPKVRGRSAKKRQPESRATVLLDPSIGYRVDRIAHTSLWGTDVSWQAVDERGHPIVAPQDAGLGMEAATAAATRHAAIRYPKQVASSRWEDWSWSGGEGYREWMITAPALPEGYISTHYAVRNLLLHMRLDLRQSALGESVLFVHEVQSDWGQGARCAHPMGNALASADMPFGREWPLLAAKLLLLHGASTGADRIAWTTGEQQAHRWQGFGERHLRRLYDELLPKEFRRLIGAELTASEVYVPVGFSIRVVEDGYEVSEGNGDVLGVGRTLQDAWLFVPDGAREDLAAVHSVRLSSEGRRGVLARGFPAWGVG